MIKESEIPHDFPAKIDYVRNRQQGCPKMLTIDLAIAQIDFPYDLSGNVFYIWSAPDETSYVTIRIANASQAAIPFTVHQGLRTPFDRLLITTPAGQVGNMTILYGTEAPELLEIIDHRAATSLQIGGILDELRGDVTPENVGAEITVGVAQVQLLAANADRKGCTICSDILNTGDIYLGFDNTVTTSAGGNIWFHVLIPGASFSIDDYRGPIHAISTVAAQAAGVGEW